MSGVKSPGRVNDGARGESKREDIEPRGEHVGDADPDLAFGLLAQERCTELADDLPEQHGAVGLEVFQKQRPSGP